MTYSQIHQSAGTHLLDVTLLPTHFVEQHPPQSQFGQLSPVYIVFIIHKYLNTHTIGFLLYL